MPTSYTTSWDLTSRGSLIFVVLISSLLRENGRPEAGAWIAPSSAECCSQTRRAANSAYLVLTHYPWAQTSATKLHAATRQLERGLP